MRRCFVGCALIVLSITIIVSGGNHMAHTEVPIHEAVEEGEEGHSVHHDAHAEHDGVIKTIEQAQHNKHQRQMRRTIRWPLHSNTHRVTF